MKVSLPNDQWAVIVEREAITERQNRAILRAIMQTSGTAALLQTQGFVDADPNTYHVYNALSSEEKDAMNEVQTVLIENLVSSWSFESEVSEDACLDLPSATYEALASACLEAWRPDETDMLDPKAGTADSPG